MHKDHSGHRHDHDHKGQDHAPEFRPDPGRRIKLVRNVLDVNDRLAADNRREFAELGLFVLNVMSSPGSGKTTLLARTLESLRPRLRPGVVVGDICTSHDAERLSLGGAVPVVQINTDSFGGDCHLAAHVVKEAASNLDLADLDLLIVENIGNLVCPAEFDVGEDCRVVVLSVTEGEDKPAKYPLMFRVCDLAVLNKIDLLPHLDYDKELALRFIREVHADMPVFELSARTGEGMGPWLDWLEAQVEAKKGKTGS
jgi:hydrogenase nickel incorporation protein HypB